MEPPSVSLQIPGSAFARPGGAGIFGVGDSSRARWPEEAAGWQWGLVRGQGSRAAELLPPRPKVSPVGTHVPKLLVQITQHPGCFLPKLFGWTPGCHLRHGFGGTHGHHSSAPTESLFVALMPHTGMGGGGQGQTWDRAVTAAPYPQQRAPGLTGVPCILAGCRVSVGARGRSPEQPAP